MMRVLKIMLTLVLCSISILLLSCASKSASTPADQVVTVKRGNLRTDITGVGNLALSHTEDLAFDIPSSFSIVSKPITVEGVLVGESDSVKEGQLLAKLDISGWNDQIAALEDAVTSANHTVTTKERAVTSAERNILAKQLDVLTKESLVNQRQLDLENTEETSTDTLELQIAEANLEVAKGNLEAAKVAVEDAKTAVDDAKTAVDDAKQALDDAKKALADAKVASPEIKAPFDGFITKVNVAGGDEVKKGTVAVTIADRTKFEAQIMVSEVDILKVTVDGNASVQVQAMPGVSFPAKVTHIAPSATIQSGVVNYQVKVELTSLQPIIVQQQIATGNVTAGAPFPRFGQSFGSANLTQEQIDQIRQQRQARSGQSFGSANLTQEQINQMIQQRQQAMAGQAGGQSSQAPGTPTQNVQLSEGMTITVTITAAERSNVLLVPSQAIISRGGETLVQVVKDGVTEERPVQTGISNWQYVEITDGLSEGEQVVVPLVTSATTSTSQQRQTQRAPQAPSVPNLQRILR